MENILTIVTVTKDDFDGVCSTIASTRRLREQPGVEQVVIDSSEKATAGKLEDYSAAQGNLRYTWVPPSGISRGFNHGLHLANSEWVWFLNGKDELHPELNVGTFMDILSSSRAGVLIFELEFMQSGERYKHPYLWALWPPVQFWIPHPATLVRRSLFDKFGGFKEEYKVAMDGEYWFRLLSQDVVVDLLSIPVALYDQGGLSHAQGSLTASESKKIIIGNLPMLVRKWLASGGTVLKLIREFSKRSRI